MSGSDPQPFADGTRVRLTASGHARLGTLRARSRAAVGTACGAQNIARTNDFTEIRNLVRWDGHSELEPIRVIYLEKAS